MDFSRPRRASAVLLLLLLSPALPADAQQHPNHRRGTYADGSYDRFEAAGVDTIDLFNGNLNIALPIGQSYPLNRPLSYSLSLHYSGNVLRPDEHQQHGQLAVPLA